MPALAEKRSAAAYFPHKKHKGLLIMEKKKTSAGYKAVKWLVWALFPKMRVEGLENLPEGGAVIVGNHAQLAGPIGAELYLGDDRYTWCAGQMMTLKEVPAYAFQDFWSMKPRSVRWLYRIFSYVIAPVSVFIFGNANTIPVYHDARVLVTFRQTLRLLRAGAKIVIFPEHNVPRNNIICEFQDRFIDLAQMYYNMTKKELRFVPMYTTPELKKMVLGAPIAYHADRPMEEERARICAELMDAVTRLGQGLPRHTVTPYLNIPKKDYPCNLPE